MTADGGPLVSGGGGVCKPLEGWRIGPGESRALLVVFTVLGLHIHLISFHRYPLDEVLEQHCFLWDCADANCVCRFNVHLESYGPAFKTSQ